MGSALTQSTWEALNDAGNRQAAGAHLAGQSDVYPRLTVRGHLDERDEDATFARGLDFLLAGIARWR